MSRIHDDYSRSIATHHWSVSTGLPPVPGLLRLPRSRGVTRRTLSSAEYIKRRKGKHILSVVVGILPDGAERNLSTALFSDQEAR